jgi:hypothetical protein
MEGARAGAADGSPVSTGDWIADGVLAAALVFVLGSIIVRHYRERAERRRQGLPADVPGESSVWGIRRQLRS